jgi:NDP-sugar pyrophosphorylase family protein
LTRIAASGVDRIVINTHRLADEFIRLFPEYPDASRYNGVPVVFRHEPVLLETGGGLKNIEDLLLPGPVLVHNGDILAELDLAALFAAHKKSGALCTLALRSSGGPLQVGFDASTGLITDIRGELGSASPRFLYTGVCVVDPALLARIPAGEPLSFVPVWVDALRAGEKIAGVILDGGVWRDIGNIEEYLRIHADLASGGVHIGSPIEDANWPQWRMPGAVVDNTAVLAGWNWLGPGCQVRSGATVENSVFWAGCIVEPGARVSSSVVREGMIAAGNVADTAV